jgi:methyltransferase-like protein/protein-L-isoaspartate O-methyltransferase
LPRVSLDSSNPALAGRYDAIPYAALPHAQTHPDRLATVATFLGLAPPPVARCRVLEVGCNDGANLIPMAQGLPQATFVGCDLSPRAIAAGRRTIATLGLRNIALVEEDLSTLDPAHGEFDYLIAHGVYSWVPPAARDGLFALGQARLAPTGVMFVSYNALPGSQVRMAAWDVLHHAVDGIADPHERLGAARRLARLIAAGPRSPHDGDDALRSEFRAIAEHTDSALFHDDLGVPNDPVYFHAFVAHAARFGLAWLGEADVHTMSAAGLSPEARALLSAQDPLAREQHLDFLRLRRFRQSLLKRRDAPIDRSMAPARFDAMHVAADASLLRAAAAGKLPELAGGLDPAGAGGGAVRALLETLVASAPAALSFTELRHQLDEKALRRPLASLLTDAYVSSVVSLHLHPPAMATHAGERPEASPLARLQAATQEDVTGLLHARVRLADPNARRLLALVDGTRDRAALAQALLGSSSGLSATDAPRFVAHALDQFARLALLVKP